MGQKLLKGALLGWLGAIIAISVLSQKSPNSFMVFLSLAPGAIVGIIVVYIMERSKMDSLHGAQQSNTPASVEDRLIKLKSLLEQGALTQEEFDERKKKLLSED